MKKTLLFISMAACLMACSKIDDASFSDKIRFNVEHPSATKATATAFEENDAISLFAVENVEGKESILQAAGNYINNEKLVYADGLWTPANDLFWSDNACDFYGFYPYQPHFSSIEYYPFSVALDQNDGGFEESDLMYAKSEGVSRSDGSVDLKFNHMMTRLVVELKKGDKFTGEIPDDVTAHVYNTTNSCVVNWLNGSVERDAFGKKGTITMKKCSNTEFEAILVPQNIEKKTPLVELTMGGIAYLLEYSLSLKAGWTHTITVTLNTSPDQEMIEISIDPSQGGWN
ncbi:MAG: fimbrillin family protein [Bacteroidales bacterium]|nr:fimbrillin family protein [Bacteroidales bacterium]